MRDSSRPWWAQPDADVSKASIPNEGTQCPICATLDKRPELELYFPVPRGPLLGFILDCGHVIEATEYALAVESDDEVGSGFFATAAGNGTYPLRVVDQKSGNADIFPVPVVDPPQRS